MIEKVPLFLRQDFQAFIVVDEVLVVLVDNEFVRTFLLFLSWLQTALLPVSEPLGLLLLFFLLRLLLPLIYAAPLLVFPLFLWLIFLLRLLLLDLFLLGLFILGPFRLGLFSLDFLFAFFGGLSLLGWLLNLCQLVLEGSGKACQRDTLQRIVLSRCSFRCS
jgi:hypothetical protein